MARVNTVNGVSSCVPEFSSANFVSTIFRLCPLTYVRILIKRHYRCGPVGIRTRDSRISSLDKSPVLYLAELRAHDYCTVLPVQFNFIHSLVWYYNKTF